MAKKPKAEETLAARKKAESAGVLAFKSSFADLMDETPVAKLGSEAKLNKKSGRAPGQARAQRSLVAMAKGSSGGIGSATVSRNIGSGGGGNSDGIGGVGFARVASSLTGLAEQEGRAVSDGPGPGRTDEEIQIVFDRYKALLYRIYNKELRKNPTLRGKILLRITIEPNGTVSTCKVESTDLASPELVKLIVARVKRFNFSPKDGVPKTTILYPIDFLPAGLEIKFSSIPLIQKQTTVLICTRIFGKNLHFPFCIGTLPLYTSLFLRRSCQVLPVLTATPSAPGNRSLKDLYDPAFKFPCNGSKRYASFSPKSAKNTGNPYGGLLPLLGNHLIIQCPHILLPHPFFIWQKP